MYIYEIFLTNTTLDIDSWWYIISVLLYLCSMSKDYTWIIS